MTNLGPNNYLLQLERIIKYEFKQEARDCTVHSICVLIALLVYKK